MKYTILAFLLFTASSLAKPPQAPRPPQAPPMDDRVKVGVNTSCACSRNCDCGDFCACCENGPCNDFCDCCPTPDLNEAPEGKWVYFPKEKKWKRWVRSKITAPKIVSETITITGGAPREIPLGVSPYTPLSYHPPIQHFQSMHFQPAPMMSFGGGFGGGGGGC